jgi:hypothetical protein
LLQHGEIRLLRESRANNYLSRFTRRDECSNIIVVKEWSEAGMVSETPKRYPVSEETGKSTAHPIWRRDSV